VTKKSNYTFKSDPPEMFYSAVAGGIQKIDSVHFLISHATNGFFLLNQKTNKILISSFLFDDPAMKSESASAQQIRAEPLTEFLKKW
jgi:hypothetical protein